MHVGSSKNGGRARPETEGLLGERSPLRSRTRPLRSDIAITMIARGARPALENFGVRTRRFKANRHWRPQWP